MQFDLSPSDLDAASMNAKSMHPAGVNVSFADGHVRSLRGDLPAELWHALLTPRGSEPINDAQLD